MQPGIPLRPAKAPTKTLLDTETLCNLLRQALPLENGFASNVCYASNSIRDTNGQRDKRTDARNRIRCIL